MLLRISDSPFEDLQVDPAFACGRIPSLDCFAKVCKDRNVRSMLERLDRAML
jgi:hypothetical protein